MTPFDPLYGLTALVIVVSICFGDTINGHLHATNKKRLRRTLHELLQEPETIAALKQNQLNPDELTAYAASLIAKDPEFEGKIFDYRVKREL